MHMHDVQNSRYVSIVPEYHFMGIVDVPLE